jgi:S-adenosylhomocysteine hydrolase
MKKGRTEEEFDAHIQKIIQHRPELVMHPSGSAGG